MKAFTCVIAVMLAVFPMAAQEPSFDKMSPDNHPRLLLTSADFENLRQADWKDSYGLNVLKPIHEMIIQCADKYADVSFPPLCREFDESNKRILSVSRMAESRILCCAYAYRVTGEEKYLNRAKTDLKDISSFLDWNPKHYLDVAEMTLAAAYGYDWLYEYLDSELKEQIRSAVRRFAFDTSSDESIAKFYGSDGNWNQVCNCGLVTAALGICEGRDTTAVRLLEDAVFSNRRAVEKMYGEDGNYPEGPGYWCYGTMFQVLMMSAMDSVLGTDFGLSEIPGLKATPRYMLFTYGASGQRFNYSDNYANAAPAYPLWYFALKQNDPSMLVNELDFIRQGSFLGNEESRLLPLVMYYALKLRFEELPLPQEHFYAGYGYNPLVMARGNWTGDSSDWYLGLKAGRASNGHGHMDAGSFVWDAYGYRWSMDITREEYARLEKIMKAQGGNFWNMSAGSLRWRSFRMNNRNHSTITINDKDHYVKGRAVLVAEINAPEEKGGVLDMTEVFGKDVQKAARRAVVMEDGSLQVTDTIVAPASANANVRWTMATPAAVEAMKKGGFILTQGDVTVSLTAKGTCSGRKLDPSFRTWSSNPADYEGPMASHDKDNPGVRLCGYEMTVPAGETAIVKVVLKKTR